MDIQNGTSLDLIGVLPKKSEQFAKKEIQSVEDLLWFLPTSYMDFSNKVPVKDLGSFVGQKIMVQGRVTAVRQGLKTVTIIVDDGTGVVSVSWFNQPYIAQRIRRNEDFYFCGTPRPVDPNFAVAQETFNITSPIDFGPASKPHKSFIPHYRKITGMSSEYLEDKVLKALELNHLNQLVPDYFDEEALRELDVCGLDRFMDMAHRPNSLDDVWTVDERKAADELFPFAFRLKERDVANALESPFKISNTKTQQKYISALPFELTKDQKKTVEELTAHMKAGNRVNALVQGDVGCGKTAVAAAMAALVAGNGHQVAIMCPTTVLAKQHYENFKRELEPLGLVVDYLGGGLTAKDRKAVLKNISNGKTQVVVGTHAVISDSVGFKSLALTIVDEEHRFGVKHRDKLMYKAQKGVHTISMTATPIPRTLALTLYGEHIKVYNIHTMPNGRKPVKTMVFEKDEGYVYASMYKQILAGHQCYVVCPLIDDSEDDSMGNVESVSNAYKSLCQWFSAFPEVKIEQIDGKLKPETIAKRIEDFAAGRCQILVSTTIIEVGVNVPNATVMCIKSAERFGLAQLHQLRGRVGRGDAQSYCVMLPSNKDKKHARLSIMEETADGFEIAQKDLELRGMGEMTGIKQSGVDKAITMMMLYPELYAKVQTAVDHIFEDPDRLKYYSSFFSDTSEEADDGADVA